jgi:hypothetical protein
MFGSSLLPVARVLFTLSVFVCAYWCPTHIVLCFSLDFLDFGYAILPVVLDCPCFVPSSVVAYFYLRQKEMISIMPVCIFHTLIVIYQPLSRMQLIFYVKLVFRLFTSHRSKRSKLLTPLLYYLEYKICIV